MSYEVCRFMETNRSHTRLTYEKRDQPAFAAVHGPHSVFDLGHCTVIHCDAGCVSLVDHRKAEKTNVRLTR